MLAGLGAIASAAEAAVAETVTRTGYRADGEAFEGLVTVESKTRVYRAGEPVAVPGEAEVGGERYWVGEDGEVFTGWRHMDDGRWVYYSPEKGGAMAHGEACVPENNEENAERK